MTSTNERVSVLIRKCELKGKKKQKKNVRAVSMLHFLKQFLSLTPHFKPISVSQIHAVQWHTYQVA